MNIKISVSRAETRSEVQAVFFQFLSELRLFFIAEFFEECGRTCLLDHGTAHIRKRGPPDQLIHPRAESRTEKYGFDTAFQIPRKAAALD